MTYSSYVLRFYVRIVTLMTSVCTKSIAVVVLLVFVQAQFVLAEEVIENIELRNLQNIDADLIFDQLPTRIGDPFDSQQLSEDLKQLFATDYFDDIRFEREDNTLVIFLEERQTIRQIIITDKLPIPEEKLRETLAAQLISEGEVLRRSTLSQLVASIEQVYNQNGQYGTKVTAETIDVGNKLVDVSINVQIAPVASIAKINIIGNKQFSDETILEGFETTSRTTWNSFWTAGTNSSASYVRQRLEGDISRLRDLYFNNGFIDFEINSTDVSISRDRRSIYISIAIFEGDVYTIESTEFLGNLIVDKSRYQRLLLTSLGDIYSDAVISSSKLEMERMLSNLGYGFAQVNIDLKKNQIEKTVKVRFFVNPGNRTYVRRVIFKGNRKTADNVIRRELRQMEGGLYTNERLQLSKSRLARLGYFSKIDHKIIPVPGRTDQLDIEITVEDAPTGRFFGGLLFSDLTGFGINIGFQERNFLGSGETVDVNLNTTRRRQSFNLGWSRPYITQDGVNIDTSLFYEKFDSEGTKIANYRTSSYGASLGLSYPISENLYIGYSYGATAREITVGDNPIVEVLDFVDEYGTDLNSFKYSLNLTYNNLDNGRLPVSGTFQRASLGLYPDIGSGPSLYNLNYNGKLFVPLDSSRKFISRTSTRLGYGSTFASDDTYPFFFNFFAGGYGTVRGYSSGSLGPRATDSSDDSRAGAIGGNILVQATQEIIFPLWFASDSVRTSMFFDIGNVFTTKCAVANVDWCKEGYDASELRRSYGFTLVWYTVVGPLIFILPRAINPSDEDSTRQFEFRISQVF